MAMATALLPSAPSERLDRGGRGGGATSDGGGPAGAKQTHDDRRVDRGAGAATASSSYSSSSSSAPPSSSSSSSSSSATAAAERATSARASCFRAKMARAEAGLGQEAPAVVGTQAPERQQPAAHDRPWGIASWRCRTAGWRKGCCRPRSRWGRPRRCRGSLRLLSCWLRGRLIDRMQTGCQQLSTIGLCAPSMLLSSSQSRVHPMSRGHRTPSTRIISIARRHYSRPTCAVLRAASSLLPKSSQPVHIQAILRPEIEPSSNRERPCWIRSSAPPPINPA